MTPKCQGLCIATEVKLHAGVEARRATCRGRGLVLWQPKWGACYHLEVVEIVVC